MSTSIATSVPLRKRQASRAILSAGLLCGILDITAAFVTWGVQGISPVMILQGIASGALGEKAFSGGIGTAALGAMFHFLIAFSAAGVFYLSSRKLSFMTRRPILSGALYGIAVYTFMYWLVLPLSKCSRDPFSVFDTIIAILTHVVCVGLPIALVIRRYPNDPANG
jgi:hypothetical protein